MVPVTQDSTPVDVELEMVQQDSVKSIKSVKSVKEEEEEKAPVFKKVIIEVPSFAHLNLYTEEIDLP